MNLHYVLLSISISATLLFSACASEGGTQPKNSTDSATLISDVKNADNLLRSDTTGVFDPQKAQQALTAYEKYLAALPQDAEAPAYLFKSAEIYRSLRNFPKAVEVYQSVYDKFPQSENAPKALFLMAFCYDEDMGNKEKAKSLYQDFLKKYPQHELANSAQFSLQNIDLTPEQIIKKFEQQRQDSLKLKAAAKAKK